MRRLGHALAADQELPAGGVVGALDPGRAGPLGQQQAMAEPAAAIQHVEPVIPVMAILQHRVVGKQAPLLEAPLLARPEQLPLSLGHLAQVGHLIEAEGTVPVALEQHPLPLGIQVVLEASLTSLEQSRRARVQQVLLRAVVVVALQQQVAPIRGVIEAQQPGRVRLLVDLLLLAIAPGPQLPGAQGARFVGDGVEGLAIQAPEQIAGPVGQGGQGLAVGQIEQGDAVIPIALQIFGQGQPAPVRVQGPAGELVVAAGRLAGRQPLAGLSLLAASLPQAAVGFHPPLAARSRSHSCGMDSPRVCACHSACSACSSGRCAASSCSVQRFCSPSRASRAGS